MASISMEEAMRMQVQLDQTVYKPVRNLSTYIQGVQGKVRLKLPKDAAIALLAVDDACEKSFVEVGVRLEDVSRSNEQILKTGLSTRVVEVAEKKT